jgi:hypothetical protein
VTARPKWPIGARRENRDVLAPTEQLDHREREIRKAQRICAPPDQELIERLASGSRQTTPSHARSPRSGGQRSLVDDTAQDR